MRTHRGWSSSETELTVKASPIVTVSCPAGQDVTTDDGQMISGILRYHHMPSMSHEVPLPTTISTTRLLAVVSATITDELI